MINKRRILWLGYKPPVQSVSGSSPDLEFHTYCICQDRLHSLITRIIRTYGINVKWIYIHDGQLEERRKKINLLEYGELVDAKDQFPCGGMEICFSKTPYTARLLKYARKKGCHVKNITGLRLN